MEAFTLKTSPLLYTIHPSCRNGNTFCKRSSSSSSSAFGLRSSETKCSSKNAMPAPRFERNPLSCARKNPEELTRSAFVCHNRAPETVAARGSDAGGEGDENGQASFPADSKQWNAWARETLEVNLAEASSCIEERSGAGDAHVTTNGYGPALTSTLVVDRQSITGGAFDFHGATAPLTTRPIPVAKTIVVVRHGLSSWNAEGRIQGSSDLSKLSDEGIAQAEKCKEALANLQFSSCFASPISRAKTSAEVMWSGRKEPLIYLDSLKEANLLFLEGMRNVDAKVQHPELFRSWREDPVNFHVDGVYPVVKLWAQAREAWQEILSSKGELVLVVTHKSILRALLCTALGMGTDRFRSVDINNGGISVFTVNTRGEPMLKCLNMTAHLHSEGVLY